MESWYSGSLIKMIIKSFFEAVIKNSFTRVIKGANGTNKLFENWNLLKEHTNSFRNNLIGTVHIIQNPRIPLVPSPQFTQHSKKCLFPLVSLTESILSIWTFGMFAFEDYTDHTINSIKVWWGKRLTLCALMWNRVAKLMWKHWRKLDWLRF